MNANGRRSDRVQVLIVGAGPTGLVLALWLTKLGVAVRIIDRTAEPGTTSRALAVTARTLELYRQMGLADALVDGGHKVPGANFWVSGNRIARLPLERIGFGMTPFPFMLIYPQDRHERLLVDRLSDVGVRVERRTELIRFDQNDQCVRATLLRPDGSEEVCEATYIAGCDGARSKVRETLGTGFPGGTYHHLFYVADVNASGTAANGEIHVDLDTTDFLAVFPLDNAGRVRLVGTVHESAIPDQRALSFEDVGKRVIEQLELTVNHVNWFSTYHVHHRVAGQFRGGRAFLLGDAAHIHSPVGGQGMNTGIGDAINLSWKLASVLNGGAAEQVLDTYEKERIGFARRLVATTDQAFSLVSAPGIIAQFVRTRVVPPVLGLLFRFEFTRRFMFRTVSQIAVTYRECPLNEGAAGSVAGGDRLPWVELDDQGSNFDPLTALDWQVHVYGEPQDELPAACAELGLPLHRFAWDPAMRGSGLMRGAVYLVRPDGYVALADPQGEPARLRAYFAKHGLPAVVRRDEASAGAGFSGWRASIRTS